MRIAELKNELYALEMQIDNYTEIDLLNIEVEHNKYGKGIVISQDVNKLLIKFSDCEKTFVINKKYAGRPTFENDTEIVEAMTEYDELAEKIKQLKWELQRIKI